jgi:hypothetical protein
MKPSKTRPFTYYLKKVYKKTDLIGAEIGIYKGSHSINLIENLPIKCIYLVDPFTNEYTVKQTDMNLIYDTAMENLAPYKDKFVMVRKKSQEVVDEVPNDLDFVYIDGDHEYEGVKKDIELYYLKVKKGGIIGGHDYNYSPWPGVTKAVNEFVKNRDIKLYSFYQSTDSKNIDVYDWWFVKP